MKVASRLAILVILIACCCIVRAADSPAPALPTAPTPAAAALAATVGDASMQKLVARLGQVNSDIVNRGLRTFAGTNDKLLTGYPYNEFYDWDLYFENVYLSSMGINDYCFTNLKQFLAREMPDGFVSRSLIKQRGNQDFKPFLAQLAVLGSRQNGHGFEWLRGDSYTRLKKFVDRWFGYDSDHNGLPTWNSCDSAGMDNQWSRTGAIDSFQDEGVDLACELVCELRAMAVIAEKLGLADDQRDFTEHAEQLGKTINTVFWDDADGFYYDRNEKTGQRVKVKSICGFFPLWAEVAPPDRAQRLVKEHLLNEKEFWTPWPIATYAKTEPDYYQGSINRECNWRGSTWVAMNYIIFHGLMHYGMTDTARELAMRTYHMALDQNAMTREYYNAETGGGNGQTQFWGFSALAYIMPLELQTNTNPMDPTVDVQPTAARALAITFPPLPK